MRSTGPLAALAWLAAIACATVAVLTLLGSLQSSSGLRYLPALFFSAAGLLLFPPLWRWLRNQPLHAGRIALAVVFLYVGILTMPVDEHSGGYVFQASSTP